VTQPITIVRDTARKLKGKDFTSANISDLTGISNQSVGGHLGRITEVEEVGSEYIPKHNYRLMKYRWVGP